MITNNSRLVDGQIENQTTNGIIFGNYGASRYYRLCVVLFDKYNRGKDANSSELFESIKNATWYPTESDRYYGHQIDEKLLEKIKGIKVKSLDDADW